MLQVIFTKKEASESEYEAAFRKFHLDYPAYRETAWLDEIRKKEFSRLDEQKHTYLDFTGGGLYALSQVKAHTEHLNTQVWGNPHSANPTSKKATEATESARKYVLKYFNTTPEEYVCIFTPNASGALKLLGESYPFGPGGHYLLTFDNHNSVNGIREFARHKGAAFTYSPIRKEDLRINKEALVKNLSLPIQGKNKLFAFPAQSNASGVKHDLEWIPLAKQMGWDVLLDAAAYVPTSPLDLKKHTPDFVSVSFYKIFGYPTGLGCLLVKRESFEKLQRPWFAGGTISVVSVQGDAHYFAADSSRFEDGTINYLDIPAIEIGLKHIEHIGIENIGKRVGVLTEWSLQQLQQLKHKNGRSLIRIYGPTENLMRGGTISMNFFDEEGNKYDFFEIEELASQQHISLRGGCFCNPGVDETNHSLSKAALSGYFATQGPKHYLGSMEATGTRTGAVRISYGYVSNFRDAYTFVRFASGLLDKKREGKTLQVLHGFLGEGETTRPA